MMKVLLTGASGRLGSVVCRHLVENGVDVRAVDLFRRKDMPVHVTVANLLDRERCYELVDGVDTLVHLAAHPNEGVRDPQTLYSENVTMSVNLFQACQESGVNRIIYASSIQAVTPYSDPHDANHCGHPYLPLDGEVPANPGNIYGLSKQACEEMLRFYSKRFGMTCVAIRFPYLANPDWARHMAAHMRHWGKHNLNINECFAYLTQQDAARLIKAVLESRVEGFRIYMPAAQNTRLNQPVREIIAEYYPGIRLKKPVEELTGLVDISQITNETGWTPVDVLFRETESAGVNPTPITTAEKVGV